MVKIEKSVKIKTEVNFSGVTSMSQNYKIFVH